MHGNKFPAILTAVAAFFVLLSNSECAKVVKRPPRIRPCLDLPEEILEQMFGRLSAGMFSAFHHTLQLAPLEKENLTCPTNGRPTSDKSRLPVNIHSISPWAYRISYDATRYPKYLPEAYCLCKGCLAGPFGEESLQFRSTPVYMPSVILRRTPSCGGGRYIYTENYISIAVGCTCVTGPEKERESNNSVLDKGELKPGIDKGDESQLKEN